MSASELNSIARSIVADDRGILAADESTGTIKKRFDSISVESTESNRRAYRNLLFTTEGMEQFIGGVILFDETIHQRADDGTPFAELLAAKGVVPGIKVDTGAHPLAGTRGETVTEGLDGLRGRLEDYYELGARFAKWRATYSVGDATPSRLCLEVNAHALARYAALCQEAGIVPIVEPEVLMDTDHSIDACSDATARTLQALFEALDLHGVDLEGTLLKPNMVIPGKGQRRPGEPRAHRRGDARLLPAPRPGGSAGDRVPLRRPVGGGGDRQPRRDQPPRRPGLAALLLLRPCPAGLGAEGVGREARERPRSAGRVPAPGPLQRGRRRWTLRRRARGAGRDRADRLTPGSSDADRDG